MKKPFPALVLFLILVVLPAATWYFMSSGLKYHMDSVEELKNKVYFDAADKLKGVDLVLIDRTTVICLDGAPSAEAIYSQFKKTEGFLFISDRMLNTTDILPNTFIKVDAAVLDGLKKEHLDKSYLIIDGESNLRRSYNKSEEDLKLLVKHIATILPLLPQRDTEEDEQ